MVFFSIVTWKIKGLMILHIAKLPSQTSVHFHFWIAMPDYGYSKCKFVYWVITIMPSILLNKYDRLVTTNTYFNFF